MADPFRLVQTSAQIKKPTEVGKHKETIYPPLLSGSRQITSFAVEKPV
jgi:hypothetical protein